MASHPVKFGAEMIYIKFDAQKNTRLGGGVLRD